MKKLNICLLAVLILSLAIASTGCGSKSAVVKLNESTASLSTAENVTLAMTINIATDYDETGTNLDSTYTDNIISITTLSKYSGLTSSYDRQYETLEKDIIANISLDGDISRSRYYINDNMLYLTMPFQSDDLFYVDSTSNGYDHNEHPAVELLPMDLFVTGLSGNTVKSESDSINLNGSQTSIKSYSIELTDDDILTLYPLIALLIEDIPGSSAENFVSADIDVSEYTISLDKDKKIAKLTMRLIVTAPSPADASKNATYTIYLQSDIYGINETAVVFPDFSEAIDYTSID